MSAEVRGAEQDYIMLEAFYDRAVLWKDPSSGLLYKMVGLQSAPGKSITKQMYLIDTDPNEKTNMYSAYSSTAIGKFLVGLLESHTNRRV